MSRFIEFFSINIWTGFFHSALPMFQGRRNLGEGLGDISSLPVISGKKYIK